MRSHARKLLIAIIMCTSLFFTVILCLFTYSTTTILDQDSATCQVDTIQTDVVVVGAGYAGLTAARRLSKLNFSVHVLEASNATGGRTKNFCLKTMKPDVEGNSVVELGGQWIGNKTVQPHAWNLIVEELGFQVFDGSYTPAEIPGMPAQYSVLNTSNGVYNFTTLEEAFSKLPSGVQTELIYAGKKLNRLSATVNLQAPYSSPEAQKWDGQTLASWINETVKLQESRTILNVLSTMIIAQHPEVVSFLHILFYVRASNDLISLIVDEQEYRVVGGTQAPTFKMARELGPGHVLLSTPVRKITQKEGGDCAEGSSVVVEADGGIRVEAKYAIVTGSPAATGLGIVYSPPLPFGKRQLFQRMPMGISVKAMVVYPTPFWYDLGYTGTIVASTPADPVISNCFDNSPHSGSPGVILCFLEGRSALSMMRLTHDERTQFLTSWLANLFGSKAKDPKSVVTLLDYNWAAQPFIGGAYSSYFPPGVWTEFGHFLREPFGQIHWAGTEYAEDGFGYINGAIQSASHTVDNIVRDVKRCSSHVQWKHISL